MKGYIKSKKDFLKDSKEIIINELLSIYPNTERSQIVSWDTLIDDIKSCSQFMKLPDDMVISIEFSLPTGGMGIDLLLCGLNGLGDKVSYIIESKQWNDNYINIASFSDYREEEKELHPQIQVNRHALSFNKYMDYGNEFKVKKYVYIRNCTQDGLLNLLSKNPRKETSSIPISNNLNSIIEDFSKNVVSGDLTIIDGLKNSEYKPSLDIIDAMKSIITKEDPFILTKEQETVVSNIKTSIKEGKKVIRITGATGSGKTAILLNLYVELLNRKDNNSDIRPIFVSGAQNTAYYRDMYPEVQNSFEYSFSLTRTVAKTKGNLYVILMDEAQHNQEGIITDMINRGATLVLCYDISQVINANNAIKELKGLENRDDFVSFHLEKSIRYNGSMKAETNIKSYLKGENHFENDDLFDFRQFNDFDSFQAATIELMKEHKNETVAVAGLLSNDSKKYTNEENNKSVFFTDWGNKSECKWMPYVREKEYLNKYDGKIWVGTWWLPGLDVDYICVIVGGDAIMTPDGLIANPKEAKHYRMMVSIAQEMKLPEQLIVNKNSFGKIVLDYRKSSMNIINYLDEEKNKTEKAKFIDLFSKLLRNNYYIMMTRARKGCFVYFVNNKCCY